MYVSGVFDDEDERQSGVDMAAVSLALLGLCLFGVALYNLFLYVFEG